MATPWDVVDKHRRHAWLWFGLILAGFLALCIGTTVWHAHQRNHPPVAQKYLSDPVQLGDISICLTNEYGYFPIGLSNLQASCSVGNAFSLPTTQQVNDVVPLSSVPAALSNLTVFTAGTNSFQANQQGCPISQSFRTGILGDIPKNCFRFETSRLYFQTNTSVTLGLAFSSNVFTNTNRSTGQTYNIQLGSQAVLGLFTDNLNSVGSFEMAYQSINSSNNVQVSPSVRHNLKKFPNGNTTQTFANPVTTPFVFGSEAGTFLSTSVTYVQMIITTTPKGYLQITEQDPLTVLTLLPAYGGFWPYFIVVFSLFFAAEPTMGLRPFIVRWSLTAWRKVRPAQAERQSSHILPMNLGAIDSAGGGAMTEAERKERAFMATHQAEKA